MGHVLVVDDHAEGRYLLRCLLEAQGFSVSEAGNGREALDLAARQTFELVVSDILMPVMDGFSLCRAWKSDARLRTIPFIVYTATYVDKPDEDLALRSGADLFLVKPTEPDVFMARLREVLAQYRAGTLATSTAPESGTSLLQQYNEVLVHKLEDKLAQLEEANRALRLKDLALASSRNGIVLSDQNAIVNYVNPPFLRLTKRVAGDVLGKSVAGLFPEPAFVRWLGDGQPVAPLELAVAVPGPGVGSLWLRLEKHAVNDEDGSALGLMLTCADITQERRLRQDLGRIERLDALSLFAAGVAHDFNNLLMAIFSVLEMDAARAGRPARDDPERSTAYAAFERARDLTRRLMSFAHQTTTERRPVDLRSLLDESIALALSGTSIRCEKRYAAGPALASVDPGQLAQVFTNLLVNARQAMHDRGHIVASVSAVEASGGDGLGTVEVSIQDDGPGITAEVMPNIFEPYFTTKAEGTGLGLASSRAIVTDHGGHIAVESVPGQGATFVVSLPAAASAVAPAETARPRVESLATGRILVMEDEPALQVLLRRGLERAGYSVVVTSSSEAAVREYAQGRAAGQPFHLALLAASGDGELGGEETLAKLRALEPTVLALATTGQGEAEAASLRSHGFAGVVTKPFLLHELYATIRAVLPRVG